MVASCYRRMGALNQALNLYKEINLKHPDNIECLKFLVQISKEMGLVYEQYASTLHILEREQEAEQAQFYDQYVCCCCFITKLLG